MRGSAHGSVRQYAAVCGGVPARQCVTVHRSVRAVRSSALGSAYVYSIYGSAYGSLRLSGIAQVCGSAAVCGSTSGSVWQCTR
jgi:hypothetical protein